MRTSFPRRRKSRKNRGPIPYVISMELAFLPEDLDEMEYEEQVREIIRNRMMEILAERASSLAWDSSGGKEEYLFEEYNERISELIEDEVAKN